MQFRTLRVEKHLKTLNAAAPSDCHAVGTKRSKPFNKFWWGSALGKMNDSCVCDCRLHFHVVYSSSNMDVPADWNLSSLDRTQDLFGNVLLLNQSKHKTPSVLHTERSCGPSSQRSQSGQGPGGIFLDQANGHQTWVLRVGFCLVVQVLSCML